MPDNTAPGSPIVCPRCGNQGTYQGAPQAAQSQPTSKASGSKSAVLPALVTFLFCAPVGWVWLLAGKGFDPKWRNWIIGLSIPWWAVIAMLVPDPPSQPPPQAAGNEPTTAQERTIEVTAGEIFDDYQQNEIRANAKYKGKNVIVTGTVSGIDADLMDEPVVQLQTSNQFMSVGLHDISTTVAGGLNKGDTVTAACSEVSEMAGTPVLRGCSLD